MLIVVDDALFEEHVSTANHPERPARLVAARAGLERAGVAKRCLDPVDAPRELLELTHTGAYLDALEKLRGKRAMIDATYVSPRSVDAAIRAAGGTAAMATELVAGSAPRGIALVRPPGHHAEADRAMGFCLINNVAVAAAAARKSGAKRIAIVDIDVHHGNGTQAIFCDDPNVLYISLHQSPFYPGTGAADESGGARALGATVNVPLSAGADDATYLEALRRIVSPVLTSFAVDLVLISAGFDAFENDPLAGMRVTASGYAAMIQELVFAAQQHNAPVGMVLEGGYDLRGLQACVEMSVRAMVQDPARPSVSAPIDSMHRRQIDQAAQAAARYWPRVDASPHNAGGHSVA